MKKMIPLFLAMAFCLTSQAQTETHELTQMQRLVREHDDIMAKDMGQTVRLIGQLQDRANNHSTPDKYERAIDDLKAANKSMVDWMHGFGAKFDGDEMYQAKPLTDEKKVWLNEEEIKFFEMKDQLKSSIKAAQVLLSE